MIVNDLAVALAIFAKYDNGDGYVAAEHDEIFVGCVDPDSMHIRDSVKLDNLYWRWNESNECWQHYV